MTVINGRLIERLASKLPPSQTVPRSDSRIYNHYNTAVQQVTTLEQVIKLYIPFLNLYQVTYFDYDDYEFHNISY